MLSMFIHRNSQLLSILGREETFLAFFGGMKVTLSQSTADMRGEWPSSLYSLPQVTEVKLGRVRSDFGWVTTET